MSLSLQKARKQLQESQQIQMAGFSIMKRGLEQSRQRAVDENREAKRFVLPVRVILHPLGAGKRGLDVLKKCGLVFEEERKIPSMRPRQPVRPAAAAPSKPVVTFTPQQEKPTAKTPGKAETTPGKAETTPTPEKPPH